VDSVSEEERSYSSKFITNRLLGSNVVYFLTFRLRRSGRYPSTLFRLGQISSTEI
jgi:hypothetical protein